MDATATLTPTEIASRIESAWSQYLEHDRRPQTPRPYVFASGYRVCERRMVLDMIEADKLPPFTPEVLAKFRRGEDRERNLLADLSKIGRDADPPFKLIGQQERFELRDHKSRVAIVGKVDARVEIAGQRAPLEVKAWSPQLVDRIESFADLFDSPWTRSGGFQLLSYLYGAGEPYGFLLLDRSGLPLLLPVELDAHLDRMEDFLARAERALDHRAAGTLPDYLQGDSAECQRCPFYGRACDPPLSAMGTQVLNDPDLEAALERREQLKAAADEYDDIDKTVKKQLRGIESGVAGRFVIEGKWGKQSRVELPADLKAQYTKTDPKGRFTLSITRL